MRVSRNLSELFFLVIFLFALTLIILYKSSHDLNLVNEVFPNNVKHISSKSITNYDNISHTQWQTLRDGTVIHSGNFSIQFNFGYIFDNNQICQTFSSQSIKVIIFVESKVSHFKRRQLIRETWGLRLLQQSLNYRIVFLLGLHDIAANSSYVQKKLQEENLLYGDIIQQNFIENVKNITLKSILILKWYLQNCANADYLLKTDDDLYIHVPNLIALLKEYINSTTIDNSILCYENKARLIIRSHHSFEQIFGRNLIAYKRDRKKIKEKVFKYLVNYSQLPGMYYPRYCAGFGYAFNSQVAQRLYSAALTIPYFFIEDVFITGFCRHKANIDLINAQSFNLRPVISPKQGFCAFNSGRINSNEMTIQEIRELWANINTQGFFCPQIVKRLRK